MIWDTALGSGEPKLRAISHERIRRASSSLATLGNSALKRRNTFSMVQGIIGPWLDFLAVLILPSSPAAACVDAATLAHSTVRITRYFPDEERRANTDLFGIRGTAWFSSSTSLVTVEHVAAAMGLSGQDWKQVEILKEGRKRTIEVRILRLAGTQAEKVAVLELRAEYFGAQGLLMRAEPLDREEQVVSLAYPGSVLRRVGGRFIKYGDSDNLAGTALLEMYDGDDRLVLDHGASGAPVVDRKGRVAAVVSNIFTQTLQFPSRAVRVSTAWGSPNVVAVPIQVLKEIVPN